MERHGYPALRPERGYEGPALTEHYVSYETSNAETTLGDTDTEIIRFSGRPDSIVLTARTNGALVTIRQRGREGGTAITVPAGETIETDVRGEIILARNLVALSNAVLSVQGKWLARGPRPNPGSEVPEPASY